MTMACVVSLAVPLLLASIRTTPPSMPAVPDSVLAEPRVDWNAAAIPPEIAGRLHWSAGRVPRFPEEDKRLTDPRKWPRTKVIAGVSCQLRIVEWLDHFRTVSSFAKVRRDSWYWLFYEANPGEWLSRRGPAYEWRSNGSLHLRSWTDRDSQRIVVQTYEYYKSGGLFIYLYQNDREGGAGSGSKGPWEQVEEVFARNGALIALRYVRSDGAKLTTSAYRYLGREVDSREFSGLRLALSLGAER